MNTGLPNYPKFKKCREKFLRECAEARKSGEYTKMVHFYGTAFQNFVNLNAVFKVSTDTKIHFSVKPVKTLKNRMYSSFCCLWPRCNSIYSIEIEIIHPCFFNWIFTRFSQTKMVPIWTLLILTIVSYTLLWIVSG